MIIWSSGMTSRINGVNGSAAAMTSMMTWDIVIGRGDMFLIRLKLLPKSASDCMSADPSIGSSGGGSVRNHLAAKARV